MKMKAPSSLVPEVNFWCPGCGHGIATRLLAEAADELGMTEKVILALDVACGYNLCFTTKFDNICGAHGRTMPTAAGIKRVRPDNLVIAYLGDGAAYSIGMESTIHCAIRNENILAVVINNTCFGMTGGQMSVTTLEGEKTTSTPAGRDPRRDGSVFDVVKTLHHMPIAYLARGSVENPREIRNTKKMLKKAMEKQQNGEGFCLVEILSSCSTNWNLSPVDAMKKVGEVLRPVFEVGEFIG
ncbi:MAG: thiamine pyrophosphate-dependent enzyme [Oscillospiraceae bacterium]|nr:thiamine pyrophosphate-dependent enzyme [Oscillospiraceae bacterium]